MNKTPDCQKWKNRPLRFKVANNMRVRLNSAIKGRNKAGSAVRDLGCSIEYFISYIESKFLQGMSWDNWGKDGWHIDHIIPLSSFDLSIKEQLDKACNYKNLRPMWAKDNLKKAAAINTKEVEEVIRNLELPNNIIEKNKIDTNKIKELILLGYTTRQVAKELNMSQTNVRYWAKKINVKFAKNRELPIL